jgi:recombination protein RecT
MSDDKNIKPVQKTITAVEPSFEELAEIHGAVNFKAEASFALQSLKQNNYLLKVAEQNPFSLQDAVLNVAAIGLTLNPAHNYAYLVPRSGKVCLDISYRGFIQLACDSGAIKWVQAELVRENDDFLYKGVGIRPEHNMRPFGDRGKIVGAYAVAKTEDSEFLTTPMSIDEIYEIRDRTETWKKFKEGKIQSSPWSTDEGEMIKKTVIKRAYKTWPKNDKLERLSKAVDVVNLQEGIDFSREVESELVNSDQEKEIKKQLERINKSETDFLKYFSRVIKKEKLESIEDLTKDQAEQAITQLKGFKTPQKEIEHENA